MRILGIETSCDDTGVAVVEDGNRILSNRISSQTEIHRPYGGVVPEIASRAHIENLAPLVRCCLQDADLSLKHIDAVAVTYGPGLAGCLLTGVSFAKSLAYSLPIPLVGIHHLQAHAYTAGLGVPPQERPPFPHLALLVSGGHTTLYRVNSWMNLEPLGSTKDDAAGEAFDKIAKALQLGFPGGPAVQKRAEGYQGDWIDFPRPMLAQGYHFSFSGLKTAVINYMRHHDLDDTDITRIAASFQKAVVDVLVTKTLRAADDFDLHHISLVGGVSANTPLREELRLRAHEKDYRVYIPDPAYSMDNGAMVAGLAYHYLLEEKTSSLELNAIPGLR